MPTTRVSALDLTMGQVEAIELAIGYPASRWSEAPSTARLYVLILAAATGRPESDFAAMTLREMDAMVSLSGDDPDPSAPRVP